MQSGERDKMILAHQKLVRFCVNRVFPYRPPPFEPILPPHFTFEDMIGEGNIALVKAVDSFNPTLGVRFSTHAVRVIKSHLRDVCDRRTVKENLCPIHEDDALFDGPESYAILRDWYETMWRAVSELPPREHSVIALYYQHNLTLREVGRELGVKEVRAWQMHKRAIERLRVVLTDQDKLPAGG